MINLQRFFSTPYGLHWTFQEAGYALLPKKSHVHPVFECKRFAIDTPANPNAMIPEICVDVPQLTDVDWFVEEKWAYQPFDFEFDSAFNTWHGKHLSDMSALDKLMLVKLPAPVDFSLQGRQYVGFLLFVEDLIT